MRSPCGMGGARRGKAVLVELGPFQTYFLDMTREIVFQIGPLVLLLLVVVLVVFRGLDRKPDSTNNDSAGGGPGSY